MVRKIVSKGRWKGIPGVYTSARKSQLGGLWPYLDNHDASSVRRSDGDWGWEDDDENNNEDDDYDHGDDDDDDYDDEEADAARAEFARGDASVRADEAPSRVLGSHGRHPGRVSMRLRRRRRRWGGEGPPVG